MDDIHETHGWGVPDDFNNILDNRSEKKRTSYDEMHDVLDDITEDMSMAVDENKWTELLIYLIDAMEWKANDKSEFDSQFYGLLEYLSKRVE